MNAVVGPLPDFAVIETGKAAVFWWHTEGSINYLPRWRDEVRPSLSDPLDTLLTVASDREVEETSLEHW